tara:strand:+ start:193 stop:1131 length:939 start_codon:yes stop_codon:yes gene_type:complete
MRVDRNSIIAAFALILIVLSIVVPSIMVFRLDELNSPLIGRATSDANVTLTVLEVCGDAICGASESCSSCSADCGDCPSEPAATGGGGGGAAGPTTYLLDFRIEEEYLIYPSTRDKIKTIFDDGIEYNFVVDKFSKGKEIILELDDQSYSISFDEIAYFDLDNNDVDDMRVNFVGETGIRFEVLYPGEIPEEKKAPPRMSKEKVKYPAIVVPGVEVGINILFILGVLAGVILLIFIYHHLRFRKIEKSQKIKLKKIYSSYKKKKKTVEEKKKAKDKLEKQINLLSKAHKDGYVSKDSYLKGRKKIRNLMKKL